MTGKKIRQPLPPFVRFVLLHAATGAANGLALATALVSANVGNLRELLQASSDPIPAMALLAVGFATLIGSVWVGVVVMLMLWDE